MLYLGIDCSTQGLTAIVIAIAGSERRVVFNQSLNFDRDFPEYGTTGGVLHGADGTVYAPPAMWADAFDRMMARLARSAEVDVDNIRAMSGSAQQHGSVYLNRHAPNTWRSLDPSAPLAPQLLPTFSRSHAPVWLDGSTSAQCAAIDAALGGPARVAALTGSPATERFTGPQIRKFAETQPAAYAETARIHLVSSFMASLAAGKDAPIDPGDGSGMNLMDLATNRWSEAALDATAPDLASRLPAIQAPWEIFGTLSMYWQRRYSLPAMAIVPWSGDNPSSLIGTGITHDRVAAVSLGTSDTVFALTTTPAAHSSHVFRAPTGDFMSLVCFRNGSLSREWVRTEFGLDWDGVAALLAQKPGNDGRLMLPWLEAEITPKVAHAGLRRFGFGRLDAEHNVRGLMEGQMMAIANHASAVSGTIDRVIATGGAAINRALLQLMANVFGVAVDRLDVDNSAARGAAIRAYHADPLAAREPIAWRSAVSGVPDPSPDHRVLPNPALAGMYAELRTSYAILEILHKDRAPVC